MKFCVAFQRAKQWPELSLLRRCAAGKMPVANWRYRPSAVIRECPVSGRLAEPTTQPSLQVQPPSFAAYGVLAVAGLLSSGSAVAAGFGIESRLLRAVPDGIVSAIRADASHPGGRCNFVGMPVDLSVDHSTHGYAVTTSEACDWGAAVGPIWRVVDGPTPVVVLAGTGCSLRFKTKTSNGLLDAKLSSATAARRGRRVEL